MQILGLDEPIPGPGDLDTSCVPIAPRPRRSAEIDVMHVPVAVTIPISGRRSRGDGENPLV
jgi:hypothetical protein